MNGPDQPKTKLLLADANILIDLAQAGGLGLIGDLVRFGLAEIFVPRAVYDEVSREVTETQVADLGITILSVTEELTEQALAYPDDRLSPQDRVLLLMAVENGYGAWTNDKKLRANCKLRNVPIYWEFEILRELVVSGHLGKNALVALARKVDEFNPYQKGVADDLEKNL